MTYTPHDPATDNPERRIQRKPHETKVDPHEFVKAVDTTEQPMPHGTGREIAPLVIADIESRMKIGEERYGERLKAFNGRNALQDAYEEALDLAIYLRQAMEERKNTTPLIDRVRAELDRLVEGKLMLSPGWKPSGLTGDELREAIYNVIGDVPAMMENAYGIIKTERVAGKES